jgi:uncharacterized protein YbjT (DUF2867 family)
VNLTIFGATGGTGSALLAQALAAGHVVTAMARRPDAIPAHDHLRVVKGDVTIAGDVAAAIAGSTAVISTFGPPDNADPGTLMSTGIANILAGCTANQRLVFESGLMCSDGTGLGVFSRLGIRLYGWRFAKLRDDKRIAERAIAASALPWTIVRPPALSHDAATGKYRHGVNAPISAAKKLPHADVAEFLLCCASDPATERTIQNIGR